ncbi:hypothetical protein BJV78DRAFT_1282698 [Lactifluus subvellereus]|nr:hypothetical protein BJV78DRAFT_1282698 [Lactifluus subvellereus]
MDGLGATWQWTRLVHVCQRWRYLVFASPLGLDLCLRCTCKTPVRKALLMDVWPPLPIEIFLGNYYDVDHVIATLKHRDRVRKIYILNPESLQSSRLVPMMQEPFPALRSLRLVAYGIAPALPDMFLGGSAPHLQTLFLSGIPFPRFPRLVLAASDLSDLSLEEIPHAGSISPEALVTGLSALTRLRSFIIRFIDPASDPSRSPPPLTRVILPTLLNLQFRGASEYLEDLVARIDAPRLHTLHITFLCQSIFDIQQLSHFIGHAGILGSCNRAEVIFDHNNVKIVPRSPELANSHQELTLVVLCKYIYHQVRFMAQICNQLSFLLSIVEQLDIEDDNFDRQAVGMGGTPWLELFRPFTAVRTLRISRPLHPIIVPALRRLIGERATEVLPVLDSLYLEVYRPTVSHRLTIEPFIAARRYSDHPVAVHFFWERVRDVLHAFNA